MDTKAISLDLANYIKATVDELGLTDCRPAPTPLPSRFDIAPATNDEDLLDPGYKFNRFLGKLLWITKTRSDVAFAANVLSRVAHRPTLAAWKIMKRVFRYLAGNYEKKLWFKPVKMLKVVAFTDASFAEDCHRSNQCLALLL